MLYDSEVFSLLSRKLLKHGLKDDLISEFLQFSKAGDISSLNEQVKRDVCVVLFEKKLFDLFVDLYENLDEGSKREDFYINELAGESYLALNSLEKARECFDLALDINSNLVAAFHKKVNLDYRIDTIFDEENFSRALANAKKRKKIPWLRDLSYIAFSVGKSKDAIECFRELSALQVDFNYWDILTLKELNKDADLYSHGIDLFSICENFSFFKYEFVKNSSKNLFITLSPSNGFVFKSYDIDADKLALVDLTASYFSLSKESISAFVLRLIEAYKYERIYIVGSSKGGSGALMLYCELNKFCSIPISCVSFSPQLKIYPFNPNLLIPSYSRFANAFMCNAALSSILENTIQPYQASKFKESDKVTVVYGNGFDMDKREVGFLSPNSGVEVLELEYSGHGSSIPLTIPEGKTLEELRVTYKKLSVDEDFKALGGGQLVDIVDQIYNIYSNPDMRLHKLL